MRILSTTLSLILALGLLLAPAVAPAQSRDEQGRTIKERLADGERVKGCFVSFSRGDAVPKVLKREGLDFFILDTEHAAYSVSEINTMIQSSRAIGIDTWLRLPEVGKQVSVALDWGPAGIIIPLVETREQAETLVKYGRYIPEGKRGIASVAGHTDFQPWPGGTGQLTRDKNRDIMLIPMIETRKGIENADEILSVEGIDGMIIGTGDLALDMGHPGNVNHPEVEEAVLKLMEIGERHGVWVVIPIRTPQDVPKWVGRGMNVVIFSGDNAIFHQGIKQFQDALATVE